MIYVKDEKIKVAGNKKEIENELIAIIGALMKHYDISKIVNAFKSGEIKMKCYDGYSIEKYSDKIVMKEYKEG